MLASHYISEKAYRAILEDDYTNFLSERRKCIVEAMKALIESDAPETVSTVNQPESNPTPLRTTSKTMKSIKYDEYDFPEEDETIQLEFF